MNPIRDYKELFEYLKYNSQKDFEYFIFILANPNGNRIALTQIYDNFVYLDQRTENVHFFMPGYLNYLNRIETYNYSFISKFLLPNGQSLNFDADAFFNTIKWIESKGYQYSESAELLLIRRHDIHRNDFADHDAGFDLSNIISFNLDNFCRININLTAFFKDCMKVVRNDMDLSTLKLKYSVLDPYGINEQYYSHRTISVFIAGSKALRNQRHVVRSALMGISNRSRQGYIFNALTFEDFSTSFINNGQQSLYNKYIRNHADYVIFILDGKIGGISLQEFNIALDSFKLNGKPKIFVYNKHYNNDIGSIESSVSSDIENIISVVKEYRQYYISFENERELELLIQRDFSLYL